MRMPPAAIACSLLASCLLLSGCDKPPVASAAAAHSPTTTTVAPQSSSADVDDPLVRGDYLVRIAGCNDCHTASYAEQQGKVDHAAWLLGSPLGYRGPWGTTYATNLRMKLSQMDEAEWLAYSADLHTRPPMPDFAVRDMHEDDRRAIYRFVQSLGPGGTAAPDYLPPGQQPKGPYFDLVMPAPSDTETAAAAQ